MRWGLGVIATAICAVASASSAPAAEVTGEAENLRTSWYHDEPALAPGQITKGRFKQVFNDTLTGQIYAQPLIANGTLLVVTEENWAYGLDPVTGNVQWEEHYGTAVQAGAEPADTIKCTDLEPRVGITGTPVIDAEHNVAYFVSNRYVSGSSGEIGWYMNAVELGSGHEIPSFPVKIQGEARNLHKETVKFIAVKQLQRPALLMLEGVVYAAFGSHCDENPYQGWIAGVSSTSGELTTMWATSGHGDSIWQSGGGLVSDGPGQILFSTGNDDVEPGVWDPAPEEPASEAGAKGKLGESVVRVEVKPEPGELDELAAKNYFSPFNDIELDEEDLDLGSSAPVGLPSPYFGNPKIPHLLVQEGKEGSVYLLNRDGLGGREKESNNVVQELGGYGSVWGAASVWPGEGGYVDIPSAGHLHFFKYGEKSGQPALVAETKSSEEMAFGSGSPIVTSNGTTSGSGALWINWCPKTACQEAEAELRAYNPASSEGAKPFWQEKIGYASKFSRPGVNNGHIYVGNSEGHVMGFSGPALVPSSQSLKLAAPVGGQVTGEVTLTVTGTELEVSKVLQPTGPFEASGLSKSGTKLKPGAVLKVSVTFNPSARGSVNGELGIVTQAGETKISLSGYGEESAKEKAEREAKEKAEREAKEKAEREAKEKMERETQEKAKSPGTSGTTTIVSLITPPAGLEPFTTEPLLSLTKLKINARASRLRSHRRKLVISYTLSAAGTVQVVTYRRVTSHSCHGSVSMCSRWIAIKRKLKVGGRAGSNLLAVRLGTLPTGYYRLAVTPFNRSGAPGITRNVEFRMFH